MIPDFPSPFDNEERIAFRELVRKFVDNDIAPHAIEWDEAGEFPRELHKKAGALGLYGLGIDEAYGGLGFVDNFMSTALGEEMGKCGALGINAGLFTCYIAQGLVHELGSEEMKQRVLPDIMSGDKLIALAVTEPSGGSDVARLETRAERKGDGYVINGGKMFITSGMRSESFVVAARTGGPGMSGISLFLMEHDIEGFTRTSMKKQGWWCSDTASLYFDNCHVPEENRLGEEGKGFGAAMRNFNSERLNMSSTALGASKVCRDYAMKYGSERETFGKPLTQHQVIRHKLVEMTARINTVQSYMEKICWRMNMGELPVADISMLKVQATTLMEFCAREASQIMGGASYMRDNPVERIYREVRVMAIGGGSEEILRDLAARQLDI